MSILFAICIPVLARLDTSSEGMPVKDEQLIQISTLYIQNPPASPKTDIPPKRKAPILDREQWFMVSGFGYSVYVYGQVKLLGKQDVVGYLYGNSGKPVYIYGELINHNEIYAQDASGVTYHLVLEREGAKQRRDKRRY